MKTCIFLGMLLQDRLRSALKEAGITANGLAKLVGVSHVAVGQWLNGASKNIKGATAIKVANVLGVNLDWLLTGSGPRKGQPKTLPVIAVEQSALPADCIPMPITPSVNRHGVNQMQEITYYPKSVFDRCGANPQDCRVFVLSSDNMAPLLNKGSHVLYDTTKQDVISPGLYVVNSHGELIVCKAIPQLNGAISLHSANPDFEPITISRADLGLDLSIAGKVLLATIFF